MDDLCREVVCSRDVAFKIRLTSLALVCMHSLCACFGDSSEGRDCRDGIDWSSSASFTLSLSVEGGKTTSGPAAPPPLPLPGVL